MNNDSLTTCPRCGCTLDDGHPVAEPTMGEVVGHRYSCPNTLCGFSKMTYLDDAGDYQVLTSEGEITYPFA